MFATQNALSPPATSRAQWLYIALYLVSALLNAVCLFGRQQHAHGRVWFWLGLLALVCLCLGTVFCAQDRLAKRRRPGQEHAA